MAYSFFGSCLILFIINMIPGLSLRVPEEDEVLGIDDAEIGEFAVRPFPFPFLFTYSNSYRMDYLLITAIYSMTTSNSPAMS